MGNKERPIAIGKPADNILPEFLLALLVAGGMSLAAFSNLLFMEEGLYNVTVDGMGHLTKVVYLAEHWKNLEFPSWCPFWYNGSTMTQYYAPLGYWMMAIAQIFTGDVMLTMKIYCFVSLFFGNLGVWVICRTYIGKWCGLFAIALYGLQPTLSLTLFEGGALAQGAIFMFTSWLLFFTIQLFLHCGRNEYLIVALLTAVLLLGHAMHAFMVCLAIAIVALPYMITGKISWTAYVLTGLAMFSGLLLCGFWWVVGALKLEVHFLPFIIDEGIEQYRATVEWFTSFKHNKGLSFAISGLVCLLFGFLLYKRKYRGSWDNSSKQLIVSFSIYLTIFSIIFSFGKNISILEYFPLIDYLYTGRILNVAALSSAVLGGYIIFELFAWMRSKGWYKKLSGMMVLIILILFVGWNLNPYAISFSTEDYSNYYNELIRNEAKKIEPFEKGRYTFIAPLNCMETFFPVVEYKFNMADGWNIEGAAHNLALWNHNVALTGIGIDYVIKNLEFWNVKWVHTLDNRIEFIEELEKVGYIKESVVDTFGRRTVLLNNTSPSTYFLVNSRNSMLIGNGARALSIEFPFMVNEYETDILKYDMEALLDYRVIFIAEPQLNTTSEISDFEKKVEELVGQGISIIIELPNTQRLPVFGISVKEYSEKHGIILSGKVDGNYHNSIRLSDLMVDTGYTGLAGLDKSYYSLFTADNRKMGDVIGEKRIENGSIIFIGNRMTQYLNAPHIFSYGYDDSREYNSQNPVKELLLEVLDSVEVERDFVPHPFNVDSADWNYQGVVFSYNTPEPEEVTISVTYTPRWKAKVDGEKWPVKSRENLIVMDLPAGTHEVELHYGMTVFGVIGYGLSLLGVILLVYAHRRYSTMVRFIRYLGKRLVWFFQFPSKQWKNGS